MVNSDLNKYLTSVLRNEVTDSNMPIDTNNTMSYKTHSKDNQTGQFIVDRIYRLDLDEII
jgi:hypothetical protein